jgi:hypothetical protein
MHAMGSRILGFSQELFPDTPDTESETEIPPEMSQRYPNIIELVTAITHDKTSVVGPGCDDQAEFEFVLNLTLDGLDRLRNMA